MCELRAGSGEFTRHPLNVVFPRLTFLFRLRFSFVSVGLPNTQGDSSTSDPQRVNDGKAPVLAQCFSEPFQVYSAKKFPGVCESTALSKCFALQGIKIPIRKEGQDGKGKKGSDDEDDY